MAQLSIGITQVSQQIFLLLLLHNPHLLPLLQPLHVVEPEFSNACFY